MIPGLSKRAALAVVEAYLDHEKWCRECLSIIDKRGVLVDMHLSPAQKAFSLAARDQELRTGKVRKWAVKGRQVHMSAGIVAEMFRRIVFMPGRVGIVVSFNLDNGLEPIRKYWRTYAKHYRPLQVPGAPPIVMPEIVENNDKRITWANNSAIWFFSGGGGDVRGTPVFAAHLTEFPYWPTPESTLMGLMNAIPNIDGTFAVVESTANGQGDAFHRGFTAASQRRELDGNEWEPFFFSSFEHPENLIQLTPTQETAIKNSLENWERDLVLKYGLSMGRVAWMRSTIATRCQGSLSRFQQEHPWSPEVAFQASGRPRFDQAAIDRHEDREPLGIGDVRVEDHGTRPRRFFIPRGDGLGAVKIYQRPIAGRRYVWGADPSKGLDINDGKGVADPDWSVMCVLDAESGEQVAVYRDRTTPSVFAEHVINLAKLYGADTFGCPEANELGFIEALVNGSNGSPGYDTGLLYSRNAMPDERQKTLHQIGFLQTERSRNLLVSQLDDALRNMDVIVHDRTTIGELRSFVYKSTGRAEHAEGCHDDTVFALALAYEALLKQPKVRTATTDQRLTPLRAAPSREEDWIVSMMR